MKKNSTLIGIVLGVAVIAAIGIGVWKFSGGSNGPRFVGQVQNFVVAYQGRAGTEIAWTDAEQNRVTLADFRGKIVLVNFWASWCSPCLRELPSIDRLQNALASDDFTVVAINIDREGKRVAEAFANRLELKHLALYMDPGGIVGRDVGVNVMPTTVLYGRDGKEIGRMEVPAEWDAAEAKALILYYVERDLES